jgi:outer membrane protein assembly factor BamB
MDGKVWMTTATEDGRELYVICVDAESGKILINQKLYEVENPEPLGNNVNSYASPSPVIESGRVYIHFGSYGTACLDTSDGKTIWSRQDIPCRHFRGAGSSPILFENFLILTFDGIDLQYLTALDKQTGKTVWRTDRSTEWHDFDAEGKIVFGGDRRKAFSTPLVIDFAGAPMLLSAASSASYAYDPRTGKELWKTRNPGYTSASRPVYGAGLAFFTTGQNGSELLAVRPDGHGDVNDTHVAWRQKEPPVPEDSSPIVIDDLLYMVSPDGLLSCLEAATGKPVWSQRIGGNYEASPIYADGNLYFFSVQGKTSIVKHGRAYELVAANRLETGCMASPAVCGKALLVRTKTDLYRIEAP